MTPSVLFPSPFGGDGGGVYFSFKKSATCEECTTCSLNEYAPVLGDFTILITRVKSFPLPVFNVATTFLAIVFRINDYNFPGY